MKCLIVDDDPLMIHILETALKEIDYIQVEGKVNDAKAAVNFLNKTAVDLLFLDIEMPEINGFELLEIINSSNTQVIIITSHKKYALNAFNYEIVDYLLKPIDKLRLMKATKKALQKIASTDKQINRNLFVKVNSSFVSLLFEDIYFIESNGDYINLYTKDKKLTVNSTLKKLEGKLPDGEFLRVHNSYIIRLDKIENIEDNFVSIRQKLVPVSRSNKSILHQKLNIL